MNQALSQQKSSTDTDKEKQYASILASVNKSQSSVNTSNTQQLIQKNKLSSTTSKEKIVNILVQESINEIFLLYFFNES